MEKKYWLHRISYNWEVSYALLKKGYLTLGWSSYAQTGILDAARKNEADLESVYKSKRDDKNKSRWFMWYLAHYQVGDIVVVPRDGLFSICRVIEIAKPISEIQNEIGNFSDENNCSIIWEDGLLKKGNKDIDLGFVVKVDIICTKKRNEYADSFLTSRMKMQQTIGDITDLSNSVNSVLTATKPINFYENAKETGAITLLTRIQEDLNPDKFERLVKAFMEKIGSDYPYIPAKNEHGKKDNADADVVAVFSCLKIAIHVQVKFHTGKTDEWAIEQITRYIRQLEDEETSLKHSDVDVLVNIPWVISSGSFTSKSKELADTNKVRLIDGLEFSNMLMDIGLIDIDKYI